MICSLPTRSFKLLCAVAFASFSLFADLGIADAPASFADISRKHGPPSAVIEKEAARVVIWEYEKSSFLFREGILQAPQRIDDASSDAISNETGSSDRTFPSKSKEVSPVSNSGPEVEMFQRENPNKKVQKRMRKAQGTARRSPKGERSLSAYELLSSIGDGPSKPSSAAPARRAATGSQGGRDSREIFRPKVVQPGPKLSDEAQRKLEEIREIAGFTPPDSP